MTSGPLLEIEDLVVEYGGGWRRAKNRAVDRVSLNVWPGETLGLVGESGSGKTTIGMATVGLAPISAGSIRFQGEEIASANAKRRRDLSAHMQVIFQDPFSSLNPSRTIGQILVEPLLVHRQLSRAESTREIESMLAKVGLKPDDAGSYPAQFSGGQRQRIAVARALMTAPNFVICDEAVSALDLSVQAQVLNLLLTMQNELSLSYLFVSHDLSVVRHMAQRVVVLFKGRVMESGSTEVVCNTPTHPYAQTLLSAIPLPVPRIRDSNEVGSQEASSALTRPVDSTESCPFAARCSFAIPICREERPELLPSPSGSLVSCHRRDETRSLVAVGAKKGELGFVSDESTARKYK